MSKVSDESADGPDLWGVWRNLDSIREKSCSPKFAAWRDVVYLKPDVFIIYDDLRAHPVRAQ